MNTLDSLNSVDRWSPSNWAYHGQILFLMGEKLTAASRKNRLVPHTNDSLELALHVQGENFSHSELAVLEKIRNERDLFHKAGINKAVVLASPETIAQLGSRLAKTAGANRVIGFALIGYVTLKFRDEWTCGYCFRQASPESNFCELHSPTKNPTRYRLALRTQERYHRAFEIVIRRAFREPVGVEELEVADTLCDAITARDGVRDVYSLKERLRVMGAFTPQPPTQWKGLIRLWLSRYGSCPKAILKAQSWSQVVAILRGKLNDKHCESEDYDLWDAKLLAYDTEQSATTALALWDGRRQIKTKLVAAIRRHAQEGLGKAEIAKKYGKRNSTISNVLKRHPHLQKFFDTTVGRKSGENHEANRVNLSSIKSLKATAKNQEFR